MTVPPNRLPLLRGLLGIAAIILIFTAMRLGAEILNPIFLGLFFAILIVPCHGWLQKRLPGWLANLVMLICVISIFGFLFLLFAFSARSLQTGLSTYETEIQAESEEFVSTLHSIGVGEGVAEANTDALSGILKTVIGSLANIVSAAFSTILLTLFFVLEGKVLFQRAQSNLEPDNPVMTRVATLGRAVARQFGLRAIVNAITGAGFAILLLLMGIDYAILWGVLTFFLSYIPYLGIVLAGIPAVILAFAEFGLERALLVIAALALVNISAENLLAPTLMGRGLKISTAVTFIGFIFWFWLIGAPGAILAMPLTILAILLLDSFPETKWLAAVAMRPNDHAPSPTGEPGNKGKDPPMNTAGKK